MTQNSLPNHFPLVFGGIFGGVGLILLIAAIIVYYNQSESLKNTVKSKGKVIDMVGSRGSKGGTTYSPIVEFQFNGQSYRISSEVSSSPPAFEIGEEVELFVPPSNPNKARINSFMENWFVVLILGFMGTIFSIIGFSVMRTKFK
jgi:hypothetical protein